MQNIAYRERKKFGQLYIEKRKKEVLEEVRGTACANHKSAISPVRSRYHRQGMNSDKSNSANEKSRATDIAHETDGGSMKGIDGVWRRGEQWIDGSAANVKQIPHC